MNDTQKTKPPWYGFVNDINTYTCYSYPIVLQDLTLVKEVVITWAHPITIIIKLRPSCTSVSAFYLRIWRHVVVLPQQLALLFNFLLSSNLHLYDIIQVVWLEKHPYNEDNLQYFSQIRKVKVFEMLMWVKDNNALYKNRVINVDLTIESLFPLVFQAECYSMMKIYKKEKVM